MLLEIAIGDAYGSGFEYTPERFVAEFNDLSRYRQHPKHPLRPGQYTDDTQMSLGTAEAVLAIAGGAEASKYIFAEYYLQAFWRDPRQGYAQGFYNFLMSVGGTRDFLARIRPDSEKSGAAMRSGPIGVFRDIRQVKEIANLQASLTHDTVLGRAAAVAAALMTHFFIYNIDKKSRLGCFLNNQIRISPWDWTQAWQTKVLAPGWSSVAAAVTGICMHDSLSDCLRYIVSLGGDVDTAAAIAMAAASCSKEMVQDLPQHLHKNLENGNFGRDYIVNLDRCLMALTKA